MGESHATVDRVAELLLGAQSVIARLPQDLQASKSVGALSNIVCTLSTLHTVNIFGGRPRETPMVPLY